MAAMILSSLFAFIITPGLLWWRIEVLDQDRLLRMPDKIKILWALMEGYRLRYCAAVAAMVLSSAILFAPPLVLRVGIDNVIGDEPVEGPQFVRDAFEYFGGRSGLRENLLAVAALAAVIAGVGVFFLYWRGRWTTVASESIARDLRDRLYDHIQHLPASYHDAAEAGDLIQRCSSDVETLRMFLASHVVDIGQSVFKLALAIPLMFYVHTYMAIWSLVLIPVIVLFAILFAVKVGRTFRKADEAEGEMTTTIQENLSGIRVVRAFARQGFERDKFGVKNEAYRRRWVGLIGILASFWTASRLMCMLQEGIVLFAGGYFVATGMTVGTFFLFWAIVNIYLWPIRAIGRITAEFSKALVSLRRLGEILSVPRESDTGQHGASDRVVGEIVFDKLSFTHGGRMKVLDDVSLRIEPGQTLAILGASGSGKSTLINLLLRLYDYETGSIRLDGQELRDLNRKYVRSQIGSVLQEPFLYSKSVRENIQLGRLEARESEVIEAASVAGVHDSITNFDEGYDTVVGERGVTLSGGQRQRIALARAILKNPPILILDDALSAVDTRTEHLILSALRQRHGRHTTLVIAHRLSTLRAADCIIVFDHGRIVQMGTHVELTQQEGLYQRLWRIQTSLADDLAAETQKRDRTSGPEGSA